MRAIDADALFDWKPFKLSDAVKYGNKNAEQRHYSYSTVMMYEIADEINDAPTLDVEPVVHGEWKCGNNAERITRSGDYEEWYECSACGSSADLQSAFCPNCGAHMDGNA